MRTLTRLGFAALLIASCSPFGTGDPIDPIACVPRGPFLHVDPPSIQLVFGTVGEVMVYRDDNCVIQDLGSSEVDLTIRDPAIASLADEGDPLYVEWPRTGLLLPKEVGSTEVVARIDGWVGSVPVVVPDTVPVRGVHRGRRGRLDLVRDRHGRHRVLLGVRGSRARRL